MSYTEIEQLAERVVKICEKENCLPEKTVKEDHILYKVYDDLYKKGTVMGTLFAIILKKNYEIKISIN